jgi:hypothetical protein
MMNWKNLLIGGVIVIGVYKLFGDKIMSAFGAEAGVNTNGDVLLGGNRVYQIPINSGGADIPVITPLAAPVSGFGSYVGQTAYALGGAENNLSELIDGASWMNAAAYTNASFGQNYSGRAVGNE